MVHEILTKGDDMSKDHISAHEDLFISEIAEKVKVSGFKWDDFVLRFEWTVKEKLPIVEYLKDDTTFSSVLKGGILKLLESHPEKIDMEMITSYKDLVATQEGPQQKPDYDISENKSFVDMSQFNGNKDETNQEIQDFIAYMQEEHKRTGTIKFKRFTVLQDSLAQTFKGKKLHEGFEKNCGLKGSTLSGG
jgi:hypothetical protein